MQVGGSCNPKNKLNKMLTIQKRCMRLLFEYLTTSPILIIKNTTKHVHVRDHIIMRQNMARGVCYEHLLRKYKYVKLPRRIQTEVEISFYQTELQISFWRMSCHGYIGWTRLPCSPRIVFVRSVISLGNNDDLTCSSTRQLWLSN